jgi:crotonobetainyl-CoA:carnitine CoA-transferase CaiB-like acyl-CoA transferase
MPELVEPPEADRALSHIKPIDLCRARSGPTCVVHSSEMGAQVVKVEALESDDDGTGVRHGLDFQNNHPNQRSITLNLKHPEGHDVVLKFGEGRGRGCRAFSSGCEV